MYADEHHPSEWPARDAAVTQSRNVIPVEEVDSVLSTLGHEAEILGWFQWKTGSNEPPDCWETIEIIRERLGIPSRG